MDRQMVSSRAAEPVVNDGDMLLYRALPTQAQVPVAPS